MRCDLEELMPNYKKIHHIAYVVRDLEAALKTYEDLLGMKVVERGTVEHRGIELALIKMGETLIELIMPARSDSPVQQYLDEHGEGFFHIALEVDNIESALAELESRGLRFTEKPRPGFRNWRVAFIDPSLTHGVLTQLLEPAQGGDPYSSGS
jgi:methylmalonyl-CoA/ethylmalonyl-CoA epimerase